MKFQSSKAIEQVIVVFILVVFYSINSPTTSFANMQNPILSGVTKLTLSCDFVGKFLSSQSTHICSTVKSGLQNHIKLPVKIVSSAIGALNSNEFGVLKMSLRVIRDSAKITGQFTWQNSVRMKGVSDKIVGKTVRISLSPTGKYDAAEFTIRILDSIQF